MTDSPPQTIADLPAPMRAYLRERGVALEVPIVSIKGGGNNQVFRFAGALHDFVLKRYFQHPTDSRDRFNTERAFYDLLWTSGLRQIPEPHLWDRKRRLGLFSFINGRKITSEEITRESVNQAIQFIVQINSVRQAPAAKAIPTASEAAFSVKEQIELIAHRVMLAGQIESISEVDSQALVFVRDNLTPAWQETAAAIVRRCESSPKLNAPLDPGHRCLSPSDFGFHNALVTDAGQFLFLDFEYAGWDDPAKLTCDFFCQPQLPVKIDFWDDVANSIAAGVGGQESIPLRARLLLPAYQIKWCCIILNHFLKTGRARREFAHGAEVEQAKAGQLAKARRLLQNLRRLQD